MKKTLFILSIGILVLTSFALADQKDPALERKNLCVEAGGTPENTVIQIKNKSLHIDCKCGDHAFTPHEKGDICRDNKILPQFDHYCLDSKGEIKTAKVEKDSSHWSSRKCMCGEKVIEKPSLTTMCENGAIIVKEH